MATAFPLIVISLSQRELSRDQAHTGQFCSPPIQAAAAFEEAEQLNGGETTKGGQTGRHKDRQMKARSSALTVTHRPDLTNNLFCGEHNKMNKHSLYRATCRHRRTADTNNNMISHKINSLY